MKPHGSADEIEIENLTIELPEDYALADRQRITQEVIGRMPELLEEHGALGEE
jgi:hypothetical protein